MFGTQNLSLFILTGILLNLAPGQDTMYILGRGIWQGRAAGVISALGISSGGVVHTLAAALGLSAILAASATAFETVKWIGAAYLIYLGVRVLMKSIESNDGPQRRADASYWTIYLQAALTNILNPKVALFFLAFLPQFVNPAAPHRVLTFLFLGSCFLCTGTLWCLILGYASGSMSAALKGRPIVGLVLEKLSGLLFIFLGVRLARQRR